MALTYVKPEPTSTSSSQIIGQEGNVADVKKIGSSNALTALLVDESGNQITNLGGATEYTEGAVDPTITGPAILMEIESNTIKPVGGFGLSGKNAVAVAIVDGAGDQISSFGGGTQYMEGDTNTSITGTAMMMEGAGNALVPAQGNSADGLLVNLGSNNDVTIASLPLPLGAATSANQSTIIGYIDGIETVLGTIDADTSVLAGAVTAGEMNVTAASLDIRPLKATDIVTAELSAVDNAVLDSIDTKLGTIDADTSALAGAVSGTEVQVDVLSVVPGTGATNLGKAHNAAHAYDNVGVQILAVRRDVPTTTEAGSEGNYSNLVASRYGQLHTLNVNSFISRTATFTGTGYGTTDNTSKAAKSMFSLQVSGTGAAATAWNVQLHVSLDGTNYTPILTHTESDGNKAIISITGVPSLYYAVYVASLTLGSATNISVTSLSM